MNEENRLDQGKSLWRKIWGVAWGSPGPTMEYITRKPDFLGAAGLFLAINLLLTAIIIPKVREFTSWSMENLPGAVDLTPEQVEFALNMAVIGSLVGAVLGTAVIWVVLAALLKLFNGFTGEKASFRSLLAVVIFSYIPLLIRGIISTALVLFSPAQNMSGITFSPALLLPDPGVVPGKAYLFLSQLDIFSIWTLALLALGGSLAMRVPFWRTFIYLILLLLIYALVVSLLSGMGMSAGT